jgi:hypothetical protein
MSIATLEVPKQTWSAYFNDLSKQFAGWNVTIEVLAGKLGDQPAADGVPLQGISYESKGGSQAGDILVEMGDAGTPFETHLIHRPRAVRSAPSQPREETHIDIETEQGDTTIVRIRRHRELPPPRQEEPREEEEEQQQPPRRDRAAGRSDR